MPALRPLTLACQDSGLDDVLREVYGARFTPRTSRALTIVDDRYSYDAVADMVDDGATRWDVCKTDATECALLGRAGLLAGIDWSAIDRHAAPAAFSVPWWGVPNYLYSYVIAYDHAAIAGGVPGGWQDFWDVERFPGKRIFAAASPSGVCEAALMGAGQLQTELYPLDVGAALARMRDLRGSISFAADEEQAGGLLSRGAGSLAFLRSTTAHRLRAATAGRIDFTWSQAILAPSLLMVPKGAPAGTDAMGFIAATQDAAVQTELLRRAGCGPVNPSVQSGLHPDFARLDPGSPEHRAQGIALDAPWYLANMRSLQPRWSAFMTG